MDMLATSGDTGFARKVPPPRVCALPADTATAASLAAQGLRAEDALLALLAQSDDCVKLVSPNGALMAMSQHGRMAMAIDDFSAVEGANWWDLWPEESREQVRQSVEEAKLGAVVRFRGHCPTASGEWKWWDVQVNPILRADGTVGMLLATSRDVTLEESEGRLMAAANAEMLHRLRNAYTISASIAMMMGREAPEHRPFAKDFTRRMNALGAVQALLIEPSAQATLDELCIRIAPAFSEAIKVGTIPPVRIEERVGRALALVFGELAANSLKYGALGRSGEVHVTGERGHQEVTLRWEEAGAREFSGDVIPNSGKAGFTIIDSVMRAAGGGAIIEWANGLPYVTLTIPFLKAAEGIVFP